MGLAWAPCPSSRSTSNGEQSVKPVMGDRTERVRGGAGKRGMVRALRSWAARLDFGLPAVLGLALHLELETGSHLASCNWLLGLEAGRGRAASQVAQTPRRRAASGKCKNGTPRFARGRLRAVRYGVARCVWSDLVLVA